MVSVRPASKIWPKMSWLGTPVVVVAENGNWMSQKSASSVALVSLRVPVKVQASSSVSL